MNFCTQCGQPITRGSQFCTGCGAPQTPATPVAPPVAPQLQPITAAPQPLPPVQRRSGIPFVLVLLGALALIAVIGIGGVVYVGYRVKEKVTSVAGSVTGQATAANDDANGKSGSTAANSTPANEDGSGLLGSLGDLMGGGSDEGDPVEGVSINQPVEPCTPAPYPAQDAARIPLQPGTVITTTWGMNKADVETRLSVTAADATSLTDSDVTADYPDFSGQTINGVSSWHTVCNTDFATANTYNTGTHNFEPHLMHDLTRHRLSDKSFQEIRSSGKTYLIYHDTTDGFEGSSKPDSEGGVLTRVEPQDVDYPMIVNDQSVTLPAIHLAGVMASIGKDPRPKKDRPVHTEADLYVIDDPTDPLVLLLRLKDPVLNDGKFRIEVTKIEYKVPHPVNVVEKELSEQKRAVTYGIYFDFNKDTIKPESEPVLKEIVQAMTDNPDWKLTVEGHTDNIGGDAYNLDLSKRRAAAVKNTLVTDYHIAADRLSTNGFGSSRPIETNDTVKGRSRNRRVELSRE